MDIAFKFLLIIHLLSLVLGGATGVAMPIVMRKAAAAGPEARAPLLAIGSRLQLNSRIAAGLLVLTGVLMLWLRYGGDALALGPWFVAKLGFVVVIVAAMATTILAGPRRANPRVFGAITGLSMLAVVICSVMTFG